MKPAAGASPWRGAATPPTAPPGGAATLDPFTGRVVPWQGTRFDIPQGVRFYQQVRAAYPEAEQIAIVQANCPVHFHPDVLVALEPQMQPWPYYRPRHWSQERSPEP